MAYKKRRRLLGSNALARKLNIDQGKLVEFERQGLVKPKRNGLGHRIYGAADIERVKYLIRLMDEGHTMKQIRELASQKSTA